MEGKYFFPEWICKNYQNQAPLTKEAYPQQTLKLVILMFLDNNFYPGYVKYAIISHTISYTGNLKTRQ